MSLTIAVDKTITNWFVKKRGLALGIKFTFIGVIGMLVMPLIAALCGSQGWRTTCLIWAAVMLCAAPFVGIFVRQKRPEYYGLLPDGAQLREDSGSEAGGVVGRGVAYASGFQETEFTLRQAMRTRAYWILVAVYAFQMVIAGGLTIHCIPFLTDMGIQPALAGSMMGIMIFSTIPTRFLSGFLADRIKRQHLLLAGRFCPGCHRVCCLYPVADDFHGLPVPHPVRAGDRGAHHPDSCHAGALLRAQGLRLHHGHGQPSPDACGYSGACLFRVGF